MDAQALLAEGVGDFMATSVVIVAVVIDPETGEPNLLTKWDEQTPAWTRLGMLQSALDDVRARLREHDGED
jgi:hypothetical protein